jgi:hypothetical protein
MMCFMQTTKRAVRLAIASAALVLSGPAFAEKPTLATMLTASEIVKITGATTLFNPLIAGVIEQAKLLFLQQDPSLSKDINEIAIKMRNDLAPRMSELSSEVAQIYARHFTEQELKDLLVFYKSPVGTKLLAEQPKIADAALKFAQDWANKLSDEVIAKIRTELKKKGHSL